MLLINNTQIKTDSEGRFSLNDLHTASGGEKNKQPAFFYRTGNFKEFVEVLNLQNSRFSPIVKLKGRNGGTWVCKELVYKYAMWISPEFEVKVIQTFDAITQKVDAPETMKALNELSKKIESDNELASKCGSLLARFKKVKKKNQDNWVKGVEKVQMNLGL